MSADLRGVVDREEGATVRPTLVDRLRAFVVFAHTPDGPPPLEFQPRICIEAADTIDQVKAERDDALALASRLSGGEELQSLMALNNALVAERDALAKALEQIKGGSFPGASNLALAGDQRPFVVELQEIARTALSAVALTALAKDIIRLHAPEPPCTENQVAPVWWLQMADTMSTKDFADPRRIGK